MKQYSSSSKTAAREMVVSADQAGQRLDNFLFRELKTVPRSRIYRLLRKGEVRVNGGRAKPAYKLQAEDRLRIPPLHLAEVEDPGVPSGRWLELVRNAILYDEGGLLVLNKPSGIAVHGGSGLSFGVIETLRALFPDSRNLELVHRLDRETSGCLLVARKRSVLRSVHEQLRENTVKKRYVALLQNRISQDKCDISAPLRKNVLQSGERIVRVDPQGKESFTHFEVKERLAMCTLVDAYPLTGRTHQIRVHAAHWGHPIAGDEKYGDGAFNEQMKKFGLRRLFLHAAAIRLHLAGESKQVEFTAPLDDGLNACLARLRETASDA